MSKLNHLPPKLLLTLTAMLGSAVMISCSSQLDRSGMNQLQAPPQNSAPAPQAENAKLVASDPGVPATVAQEPKIKPQLIKKASLQMVVDSVKDGVNNASKIVAMQQGDVLGLQDNKPADGDRHTASMEIRVPQEKLDFTLAELAKLGKVQNRTISAEDVSTQLVDIEARLRNLRRTETALLEIMQRSGSVTDVLKVSQELSNVRQQIEQIDAQFRNLKNQVAYSTISLAIEETLSPVSAPERSVNIQLQESWNRSTRSLGDFTTGLLGFGIWLFVYSPYLLLAGGIFWLIKSRKLIPVKQVKISDPPSDPGK